MKSKAALLLSKHDVKDDIKAELCPKSKGKAEPCPKPQKQDSFIKVEPELTPKMDNGQLSTYTISDDHSLSSHSCNLLNADIVSSLVKGANEYEDYPPTQLSKKGDAFPHVQKVRMHTKLTRVPRHGSWICESCTMSL